MRHRNPQVAGLVLAMALGTSVIASQASVAAATRADEESTYSPVVRDRTATNLYWGDTHLHTRNSADAFTAHNEGIAREDAFRFAMGLPIRATNGMEVRLRRPLDFLVITDHAEYMGVFEEWQ
jgi:hypothetical protein